ncbi:MAG: hypothetical protein IKT99_03715 [Oscillospiraceae bacterium]|nr:hypothetical protein [Oscillospiraceae bacterium]
MKKAKRILSVLLALVMLIGILPQQALAAGDWAYVRWENGGVTNYGTFRAAWDAATSSGNNNTVGLYTNWDGGRFCVPEGKTVTLELNGWVLTRDRGSSTGDGEVLYVGKNAKLYVYGGTKADPFKDYNGDPVNSKAHSVSVYVANGNRYDYTRRKETLYGGIINGGNSDNGGGGIHMKESARVYLYNVTIAGNKADNWGASYGDGGGIEMNNKYGYVYMEDSQIIYNAARYDGGGIHVDSDFCRVDMVRSRIDHNVADDNGGGIYVDGDHFIVKGDAEQTLDPEAFVSQYGINDWDGRYNYFPPVSEIGSSISYNCVFDTEDGGGGIYMDNEFGLIEGLNICGNITTDDAGSGNGDGGGIYLDEEEITVRNCNILRNKADERGGGIHVRGDDAINDYDDNTVDGCTVYKNLAWDSSGAGGGIFVYKYCDLAISGKLIVRGNVSKSFGDDNLYLSTDGNAVDAYLIPSVSPGADVHVRLSANGTWEHGAQISRDPGTYDSTLFTYDNKDSEDCLHHGHIGWDRNWNDRYLRILPGAKPANPETLTFTPANADGRTSSAGVYTVDEIEYPIIKGVFSYPSFPDDDADIENVFYYSDGFFAGSTDAYNPQLATASMCLAGAAGYSNEYGKDDHEGGLSSDYLDKSQNFRQFVSDIGCADADIYVNDFNTRKPGADTIGVGIASKDITIGSTQKKLVIIGVRGMGYEKEWISNMTLGASGEAAGWSSAANQVFAELKGYLSRKGIDGTSENTIFWIAGYSRAGATSNLTAKRIVDTYDNAGTHTFAYPLEAPKGGVASAKVAGNNYNCIHNIVNQNDIVPWTGTTEMGFIRYGVDHYIPGSPETHTPAEGSDHILKDNAAWDVAGNTNGHGGSENYLSSDYWKQEVKMIYQLKAVNPDIVFDDYYHRATINYVSGGKFQNSRLISETGGDAIVGEDTEAFVKYFFENLQCWAFGYTYDGKPISSTNRADLLNNPRKYFSSYAVTNGKTFQQAAAAFAGVIFGLPAERKEGLMEVLSGLMDRMDNKMDLWLHLDKSGITDQDLKNDLKSIWKQLTDPSEEAISMGARSIRDFLTDEEFNSLNDSYMSLLYPLLCFAGHDYTNNDQTLVGTAAYNIPRIIANHYPEVTHSWLRSYDYLYENDDTNPVVMADSAKTGPSAVALEIIHKDGTKETVVPDGSVIEIEYSDTVKMVPSDPGDVDKGEAIYYRFTSGISSEQGTHAFSDPIDFKKIFYNSTDGVYTLLVTAAHNGVKLPETEITLQFSSAAIYSAPVGTEDSEYVYSESDPLKIGAAFDLQAFPPNEEDTFVFKHWEARYYHPLSGGVGIAVTPDKYVEFFGESFNANQETTSVVNLSGESIRFIPVYDRVIDSLDIMFQEATSLRLGLPVALRWKEPGGDKYSTEYYPIFWTHDPDTGHYIANFKFPLPQNVQLKDPLDITYEGLDHFCFTSHEIKWQEIIDQKAVFSIEFVLEDTSEADESYASRDLGFIFYARDLNLSETENIQAFRAWYLGSPVFAPEIPGMQVVKWQGNIYRSYLQQDEFYYYADKDDTGSFMTMAVYYRPIVNSITITLDKALFAAQAMPALNSATVTIENTWRIDNAELSWSPDDATAAYETNYTACVTVNKAELMGTNLNDPDGESVALAGRFVFSGDLSVTVQDTNGNEIAISNYSINTNDDEIRLDLVFEKTAKQPVVRFADVSLTVPHGSSESDILAALPAEVYAYLASGQMVSVPVEWTGVSEIDQSTPDAQTVTASGSCTGGDYAVPETVSLTAAVTVAEAERTAMPTATPGSGSYEGVQSVTLTADEGATVRYAIREIPVSEYYTETIDPDTGETVRKPDPDLELTPPAEADYQTYTEPVTLTHYDVVTLLYAIAEKDGLRESAAVTFTYELTKPETVRLEAKEPTIAQDGNIECWYTFKTKDGEVIPEKYYADENATQPLDYKTEVRIPAFIATSHPASADDAVADCLAENEYEPVTFHGFETLGVQAIGEDGAAARVLTVLDARVLRDATDYGYLFGAGSEALTVDTAPYSYSCKCTQNTLYSGDYAYVTARIEDEFLAPEMKACFYVRLENGTDYIYTDAVACDPAIPASEATDAATDNISLPQVLCTVTIEADEGCTVTVTAVESQEEYAVTPIASGDTVPAGTVLAVSAEAKPGYRLTVTPEAAYTVTGDLTITAATEALTYTVTATATEGGAQPTVSVEGPVRYGTEVTVTASAPESGYEFTGWYQQGSSERRTSETAYTFTVIADLALEARYQRKSGVVTFVNGDIVQKTISASGITQADFPADPVPMYGHQFDGWDKTLAEINAALANGENVTVNAKFRELQTGIVVTVYDDESATPTILTLTKSQQITVTAKAVAGKTFAYWTMDGTILSYNEKTTFLTEASCTVRAVYTEQAVEAVGTALIRTGTYNAGTKKLVFVAYLTVPQGAKITASGLVAAAGAGSYDPAEALTLENADYVKNSANAVGTGGPVSYTWTKTGVCIGDVWYARPYVSYTCQGESRTVYGDRVKITAGCDYDSAEKATATIRSASYNASTKKAVFAAYLTVPAGSTISKAGLVAAPGSSFDAANKLLTWDTAVYKKYGENAIGTEGPVSYTWTKTSVNPGDIWYVRAYVMYTDDTGKEHKVYGELFTYTAG